MRAQEEIVARIAAIEKKDFFGFERIVLLDYLDFDHIRGALEPLTPNVGAGLTRDEWEAPHPPNRRTVESMLADARDYADFAWGKVRDHRGLSAGRNIDKMPAWAWLLGHDDAVAAVEAAEYGNYGANQLRILCGALGFPMPDEEGFRRMARGEPCQPGCDAGCDS